MKQVAIHAYPFGNVGDDLFIRTLCERYPHVQFHLAMHMEYAQAFHPVPNLTLYPVDSFVSRVRARLHKGFPFPRQVSKQLDATVYIGGSLFMEQVGWEKSFTHMTSLKKADKPFFIIGANFGPYHSHQFIKAHERFFKQVTAVSFRDTFSYHLFAHVHNVRYAPDVIFSLYDSFPLAKHPTRKHMLISVIYPSVREHLKDVDERYFMGMACLVEQAIQHQYTVTLSAFCSYENDDRAIAAILHRLEKDIRMRVHVHVYRGKMDEVYHLFQQATHVVATRFHAMVLGWLFNKHVFPITYSEKMEYVLEDMSYAGEYERIEQIDHHVFRRVHHAAQTTIGIQRLAEQSHLHFNALDQFLSRE